jgi:hypothetical protein
MICSSLDEPFLTEKLPSLSRTTNLVLCVVVQLHLHSSVNFVTPAQRHQGVDAELLAKRKAVYERTESESQALV